MEPLDAAYKKFCQFVDAAVSTYWHTLKTETDVRTKLIDRIFVDILGWPMASIHLEDTDEAGRLDYRMTVHDHSRLIVEAKRECRDLGINETHSARFFKLNGAVFKTEASEQAIKQLIGYCGNEGAELACATNGRQWFVFIGSRLDGIKVREGFACVFGSLDAVKENFQSFYNLLAYEAVEAYNYRAIFHDAEGQPVRPRTFRRPVRAAESRRFLEADHLSRDLDRVMLSFFQDLSGHDDPEARRACFVTTSESTAAERGLVRISEELRNRVQSLATSDPSEITDVIKRAKEMQRHEMILLVGTKGSGKSTFIDRFFNDVLVREIKDDCVVIRIDLSPSAGDASKIVDWLDTHVLEAAELAAFRERESTTPTFEDLQGMFYGEYCRLKSGSHRPLYERDKNAFKEMFGQYVETIRQRQPRSYILGLLRQMAGSWKKIPCLIFDNADHFDVSFQEAVFNYANSIYSKSMCLLILPITDTTSWQLPKQGPLQSFQTELFFLPTPPTEQVLRRRIEFIESKVAGEQPETGKGYFIGRGIPLELGNIRAFTACLQSLFTSTGQVAQWIGRLSNHDVRRSLQLTREIVSSPHIGVGELLKAFVTRSTLEVSVETIKIGIICGKYDIYPAGMNSFVQNVFAMCPELETSPLLLLRMLAYLRGALERNPDNDGRYVTIGSIQGYFQQIGISPHAILKCSDAALKTGMVLDYDPTVKDASSLSRLQLSPSGLQHLLWGLQDWAYLESMAVTTPLLDQVVFDDINANHASPRSDTRRTVIRRFIEYLLIEDSHFIRVPKHELYEGQIAIERTLRAQVGALLEPPAGLAIGRYARQVGRVSRWFQESGYGFVKYSSRQESVFLHISDVVNQKSMFLCEGDVVEFDVVPSEKGCKATNAYVFGSGNET